MKINGISISGAEINRVIHNNTLFSGGKATPDNIIIDFKSRDCTGTLSMTRKEAGRLSRLLKSEIKTRESKAYLRREDSKRKREQKN